MLPRISLIEPLLPSMYQLIILLPAALDIQTFDTGWPAFLAAAEKMPGLLQESVTRIDRIIQGSPQIQRIYTFSFQDRPSLEEALISEPGEIAGDILQKLTGGNSIILTGSRLEDSLDRIQSFPSLPDEL